MSLAPDRWPLMGWASCLGMERMCVCGGGFSRGKGCGDTQAAAVRHEMRVVVVVMMGGVSERVSE